MTRVRQEAGTVAYKVIKLPMEHFEVDTPMLAVVTKGTEFTVIIGTDDSAVEVREGLVEVVDMDGGMKALVPAGRSARVHRSTPKVLEVK